MKKTSYGATNIVGYSHGFGIAFCYYTVGSVHVILKILLFNIDVFNTHLIYLFTWRTFPIAIRT
jgi:hypothetical protein